MPVMDGYKAKWKKYIMALNKKKPPMPCSNKQILWMLNVDDLRVFYFNDALFKL